MINKIFRKKMKKTKINMLDPQQHIIEDLQQQIQIAVDTIQQYFKRKKQRHVPWMLFIGAQGVGKTSLLAHSKINLVSPLKKSIENVGPTKSIDWWISDEAVFVDPSGKYCLSTQTEPQAQQYWHAFLQALSSHRTPIMFDKICFVVDLPSLIYPNDPTFSSIVNRWSEQIHILAQLNRVIAIDIIITQCDHMAGFAEFFANLRPEDREQALGFSLADPDGKYVNDRFFECFKLFIQMINHRLLDRLHHEPNLERRQRINEFTLQLERLFKPLNKIISCLPDSTNINVNNIFFCSCQQTNTTVNMIAPDLEKAFQIKTEISKPLIAEQNSLFISQMLKRSGSLSAIEIIEKAPAKNWWHIASYPAAFAILLGAAFIFHNNYQKNMNALHSLKQNLTPSTTIDGPKWLAGLNSIYQMRQELALKLASKKQVVGFEQSKQLKQKVDVTYQQTLRHLFMTYLSQTLAAKVQQYTNENSSALYHTLEAYLMLAKPDKFKADYISQWFNTYWKQTYSDNPALQQQLNIYLQDTLQLSQPQWKTDHDLIGQAQVVLQEQPLAQIAYKMLLNNNKQDQMQLTAKDLFTGVDVSHATISTFYSTLNFGYVYQQQIPNLAQSFDKGDWVIGKTSEQKIDVKQLTQELRDIYLQHYCQEWQNSLNQITFVAPKNFNEAVDQINLLLNPQSPLWQLYQNALKAAKNAGAQITLDNLTEYMPDRPKAKIMTEALTQLHDYLKGIKDSPSNVKTAFDKTVQRYQTNGADDAITLTFSTADKMPAPIQQWMRVLAHNSWKLMLQESKLYMNTLWKTSVASAYHKTIENRYPIYNSAKNDIQIKDFDQFFGPGGVIQNYFNNYLKPFVDLSQVYWSWKKLDGEQIDIAQTDLDMLIRASMIQKMFYTDDHTKPSFKFKLAPVSADAQFALNIGGQMVRYTPGTKSLILVNWPGPDGSFVTLRFNNPADQNPTATTMGAWAWLRMVDEYAKLKPSSDPRSAEIIFNLKNNKATFQLSADNAINPYLPNVLSGFRCPDSL